MTPSTEISIITQFRISLLRFLNGTMRKGLISAFDWVTAFTGMTLGFLSAVAWLGFLGHLDQLPSGPALMAMLWAGALLGWFAGRGVDQRLSKRERAKAF